MKTQKKKKKKKKKLKKKRNKNKKKKLIKRRTFPKGTTIIYLNLTKTNALFKGQRYKTANNSLPFKI